jgi:hypothetical protein
MTLAVRHLSSFSSKKRMYATRPTGETVARNCSTMTYGVLKLVGGRTLKLTGGVLAVRVECLVRHSLNYDTTWFSQRQERS